MGKLVAGVRPAELRDEYSGRVKYTTIRNISQGRCYKQLRSQVEGAQEYLDNKRRNRKKISGNI